MTKLKTFIVPLDFNDVVYGKAKTTPTSKAYELPNKKKFPKLYKTEGFFSKSKKDTKKLGDAIKKYARENLPPNEAKNLQNFVQIQGEERLFKKDILCTLHKLVKKRYIREVEFVLALQGEKLEKKDMFYQYDKADTPLWEVASHTNLTGGSDPFIVVAETLRDADNPLTKNDLLENKKYGYHDCTIGKLIAIAASRGNLDQIKKIVEMNGEKLTKQDLMLQISTEESAMFENDTIALAALRARKFNVVEQILTEEEKTLCINDVFKIDKHAVIKRDRGDAFVKLLTSPVFKDTSKNISEMWERIPDNCKNSGKNQKIYKTAVIKATAQSLNKGNIAAIKKTRER